MTRIFWIFGILQSMSLGIIIFLLFRSLNLIKGDSVIGCCCLIDVFGVAVGFGLSVRTFPKEDCDENNYSN